MLQTTRARFRAVLRPGSGALWAGVLFLLLFAVLALLPIQPADFWWHLKVGEIVLDEGRIPRVDLFSYTAAGQPFVYQSWLAGVVFAQIYRLGGAGLVVLANAVLLTAAYGLLWSICREKSDHPHVATVCTLAAVLVSLGNWNTRPQTFSAFLLALFLWVLQRFRQGKRTALWVLPGLIALWANLHGAFILGIALLGAALVGEVGKTLLPGRPFALLPSRDRWALLWVTLASLISPLLNPIGWGIWEYIRTIQSHPIIQMIIAEWKPPQPGTSVGAVFFLSLLALFFLLLYRRHRPDPVEALWLAGTTWLAFGGVRSIIWYSFVMAMLAADGLAGRAWAEKSPPNPSRPHLNVALLGLFAVLAFVALPWFKGILPLPPDLQGIVSRDTPVQAAEFVEQEQLQGRLFQRMEQGGFLLWRFYPERRTFIDPRIELISEDLWQDYVRISTGAPETGALLQRYKVAVLLLDADYQAGLVNWALESPQWALVYENAAEGSVVFARTD